MNNNLNNSSNGISNSNPEYPETSSSSSVVTPVTTSEDNVIPTVVSDNIVPPVAVSEDNVIPTAVSNNVVPPVTVSENNVIPSVVSDNIVPPVAVSEDNVIPTAVSNNVVPPVTVSENNVIPSVVSDNIVPPVTVSEDNVIPTVVSDNIVLPVTASEGNVIPTVVSDNIVTPVTVSEDSVIPTVVSDNIVTPVTTSEGNVIQTPGSNNVIFSTNILTPNQGIPNSITTNNQMNNGLNIVNNTLNSTTQNQLEINNNLVSKSSFQDNTVDQNNSTFFSNNMGNTNVTVENKVVSSQDNQVINALNIEKNQNYNNSIVNSDEELLKAFVGNNYEIISRRKFNFAAFFFGFLYMFYRKMFLHGLLTATVLIIIVNLIDNTIIQGELDIALFIFIGLITNKMYLNYANKKISRIKSTNNQKSIDELKEICSKTGRTSISGLFLGFLVAVVIAIVFVSTVGNSKIFSNLFKNIKNTSEPTDDGGTTNNSNNDKNSGTNDIYEGMLMTDTSVNVLKNFSIVIPKVFKEDSFNGDDQVEYNYEGNNGVFDGCSFSLRAISGYFQAEDLIKQMQNYNASSNPTLVTKQSINGILWSTFNYSDNFGKTYYYGTVKDKKVYLFEYEIEKNAPSVCETYKTQILNSIKTK